MPISHRIAIVTGYNDTSLGNLIYTHKLLDGDFLYRLPQKGTPRFATLNGDKLEITVERLAENSIIIPEQTKYAHVKAAHGNYESILGFYDSRMNEIELSQT